jgi:superfamily II DNA/RNA helicase
MLTLPGGVVRHISHLADVASLRHIFCSHLAMNGATAKEIQELAGHESATTEKYMHLSPSQEEPGTLWRGRTKMAICAGRALGGRGARGLSHRTDARLARSLKTLVKRRQDTYAPQPMSDFSHIGLLPTLQTTLAEKGLLTPTEVQRRVIPALLAGRSVVGVAETGSGKTLAYALPVLHVLKSLELKGDAVKEQSQPRAAIVVPTRDLGEQVSRVFKLFTHDTRLRVRTILGGTKLDVAKTNVSGSFEILVATPGRMLKLVDRGLVSLRDVRTLIFDEADQMLDQGFLPDAKKITAACPAERQMALFSATVSPQVQALMTELFSGVEIVRMAGSHRPVKSLTTANRMVQEGKREPLLARVLKESTEGGTLIFTNTREQCDTVAKAVQKLGYPCVIYRGEMDKVERRANLKAFRAGGTKILISTDLASRGLDIPHVGRVINYHLPREMEHYLHRVGRTARAGREGLVVNFVTERDQTLIAEVEKTKD